MEQTTKLLTNIPPWILAGVHILNAMLLALTGYTIGQQETAMAITTGVLYAAGKKFIELAQPPDK